MTIYSEPHAQDYATPDEFNKAHDKWQAEKADRPYDHYDNRNDRTVSDLDFNRIGLLLMVIKESVLHGPSFTNIIAEANFELLDINTHALEFATTRAKTKADAEAKIKADEQARVEELAREQEDKLRKERDQAADEALKTKAQIAAVGQAKAEADMRRKAEADRAAGRPVDPVAPSADTYPPDHIDQPVPQSEYANNAQPAFIDPNPTPEADITPNTTFTSDNNGRRI